MSDKDQAIANLNELRGSNLWADKGGIAISDQVVDYAIDLVKRFDEVSYLPISPTPYGTILFEKGPVSYEIGPAGIFEAYGFDKNSKHDAYDYEIDLTEDPEPIIAKVREFWKGRA
jgi:hypothetical protein